MAKYQETGDKVQLAQEAHELKLIFSSIVKGAS